MEPCTMNIFLGAALALQGWQLREIIRLRTMLAKVMARCPKCQRDATEEN